MEKTFDLSQFDEYREDNRREVKKADGGLPVSLWDTYSSLINADYHGLLGVVIRKEQDKLVLANPGYTERVKSRCVLVVNLICEMTTSHTLNWHHGFYCELFLNICVFVSMNEFVFAMTLNYFV